MHSVASEDQQMLVESVRRFLQTNPSAALNSLNPGAAAVADAGLRWRDSAEQGWLQVLVSEERGGLGLSTVDAAAMAEEMGHCLLDLPVSQAMAFAGLLAQVVPDEDTLPEELSGWLDGSRYCAIAVKDAKESDNWAEYLHASAGVLVTGWEEGRLYIEIQRAAQSGHGLDPFIATARLAGANRGQVSAAWDLPDKEQVGAAWDPHNKDQIPAAWDLPDKDQATTAWHLPCPSRLWRRYEGQRRALRLAELLGVSRAALERAVGHACEREQFGKPIGVNQAIKHALADNWMALDNARLVLHDACMRLDDEHSAETVTLYLLMAELLVLEASTTTTQAIQTHGALGIAWESGLHLYLRRASHGAAALRCRHDADSILEQIWALSDT
ncbi:acyl-CoA dehydrogenase family protein [Allopusillimonas ginsengisoli]|uniref:acyl-CoA dehydrogenase n=1 Tax=Allopusillimonas ginsengisoli TaxID=453575 RepID=UPI0010C1C151|nr:hypothetical protein D7I39_02930 [Allopusillimonas ginsengisoli]